MGQLGFFGIAKRYAALDAKNDPLAKIDEAVPWEEFRARLEAVWRTPDAARKSAAGRKPWDAVVMFKAIVLCELYSWKNHLSPFRQYQRLTFLSCAEVTCKRERNINVIL